MWDRIGCDGFFVSRRGWADVRRGWADARKKTYHVFLVSSFFLVVEINSVVRDASGADCGLPASRPHRRKDTCGFMRLPACPREMLVGFAAARIPAA
jgi:hypothetical protein